MITKRTIKEYTAQEGVRLLSRDASKELEQATKIHLQELCKTSALICKTAGRKKMLIQDVQVAIKVLA